MKVKIKEYLPLRWCKELHRQTDVDMKPQFDSDKVLKGTADFLVCNVKNRNLAIDICKLCFKTDDFFTMPNDYIFEAVEDINALTLLRLWEKNKQVIKLDKDFTDELIKTNNLMVVKDAFKFLPYNTFYVDISDNKELCEAIMGEGFFITVRLAEDNRWYLHLCKVTDTYFFSDVLSLENGIDSLEIPDNAISIHLYEHKEVDNRIVSITAQNKEVRFDLYQILIIQLLTYLSSTEPDITENEETRRTYRKPVGEPKNKYSEIQKWDVGVRFGTAIRKWKTAASFSSEITSTGRSVRPHTRRAHWQHFWYGKKDEERVRRPKWVAECLVNVKPEDELPTVIHELDTQEKTSIFK